MRKLLLCLQVLLWLPVFAYGEEKDPVRKAAGKPAARPAVASARLASGLDAALADYLSMDTRAMSVIPEDRMTDLSEYVSMQAEDDRQVAGKMMSFLDQNPDKLRDELVFEDLVVLPVGVKKKLNDKSVLTIGVLKAEFKPTYAELTIFIRLNTQVNNQTGGKTNRDLFFGVEGIKLTKQGGMSAATFKAVLLGDFILPFNEWAIHLKGGIDKSITPAPNDTERCYVQFDCGAFQELNIAADIVIPRSKLLPCDLTGKVIQNEVTRVKIEGLQLTTTGGLRDIVFDSGNITPFALPKHPEYAFVVSNLAFDMSDFRNPSSLVAAGFPAGYEGDTDEKWQGLYVGQFQVLLPEEFEDADNSNQRISISAQKIYWDRTGFSGFVGVTGLNKKVNARKWTLSLNRLRLGFLQNKFMYGEFGGKVETPIHKSSPAPEELFDYEAVVWMDVHPSGTGVRSNYRLSVITERTIPLNMWWASGKIYPGSQVNLSLVFEDNKYRFKPYANLSGEMKVGANASGDETGTYQTGKMIDLGKIEFYNLKIQTQAPYISVDEFVYTKDNNNLIANFPVQLTKFQKYNGMIGGAVAGENQIWTEVGFGMVLFKDNFSGSSTFVLRSEYNTATGKIRPKGITFRDIAIKGKVTGVSIDGYLGVYEDATRKEIKGMMNVSMTTPKPFEAGINVLFANNKTENYKYGFVDGFVMLPSQGVALGPVELYGAGMSIYWNMKPESMSVPASSPACATIGTNQIMRYCPNRIVPFGIRLMAAIKNLSGGTEVATNGKSAFKARVYLDFALNREYGINHIAIYGNGVIAGDFTTGDNLAKQIENAKKVFSKVKGSEGNGSSETSAVSQAKSKSKAEDLNKVINNDGSPGPGSETTGIISFTAGVMLDIPNKLFHVEAEVFLKQGDFTGIGPYGRVGRAEIHFEPGKWYIHAGRAAKPDRIGLKYGNLAQIDAYLMVGHGVPQFPAPDREILEFFPSLSNKFNGPVCTNVSNGSAFAFGASARLNIEEQGNAWFFQGLAVAGLDILISNNASCSLVPAGQWFGQGQLYALVRARAGGRFLGKNVTFLNAGLGLYAYMQAPKPFGMDADVCISVPRWVSKQRVKCIGVSIGENCTSQPTTCN